MGQVYDNQIGYVDEVTWGTRVVPTRFLEFNSEAIKRRLAVRASSGLRKSNMVQRSDRQSVASKGANGPVQHDIAFTGYGLLLKHLFGAAPTISQPSAGPDPTVYEHLYKLGDGVGLGLTTQVGRPGSDGTVRPYDFLGCKVTDGGVSQGLDAYAALDLNLDAQTEQTNQTLATASYPAGQVLLDDSMLKVTVNGSAFDTKQSGWRIDRALNLERYFQRQSTLKKEPKGMGLKPITGSLAGEFEDLTTYAMFTAGTIVPIVFQWLGATISSTYKYEFTITMAACRLDGPQPATGHAGILDADTPFTVLNDGTNEPITALLRTTDTAV